MEDFRRSKEEAEDKLAAQQQAIYEALNNQETIYANVKELLRSFSEFEA